MGEPDSLSLLGDDNEAFEAVLAGDAEGPAAVVGDPFAGRKTILSRAVTEFDATWVSLDPGDGLDRVRTALDDGPVVIEDCQHLYERRIGGFERLSAFLDALARTDATVVTGWNRYAWAYLGAVQGVDGDFPVVAEVQALPTDRIAELVLDRYDDLPTFVADEPEHGGVVVTTRREVGWRDWSVSVPLPSLSPVAIRELLSGGDLDPKDVAFGRLASVSKGNYGVATAIWESSQDAEMRPSDVAVPASDRDLAREEAFCLRVVLASERVQRDLLAEIVDDTDRVLARLSRDGLLTVEDEVVKLVPAAVPTAAAATERGRVL